MRIADVNRGGDLMERLTDLRKQIAQELGLLIPPVHVHENPELSANDYAIRIRGHAVAHGVTYPEQFLAVRSADAPMLSDAESTACPVTQAPAYWITESQLPLARELQYDIIESPEVLTAHLAETVRSHAHELLTRQEMKNLLDHLKTRSPALIEEVIPSQIKPGELHRVLQNLLRERVSIRDLETILETLADHASETKDLNELTEHARQALARSICHQYVDAQNRLACVTLDPTIEKTILDHVQRGLAQTVPGLPPRIVQNLIEQLRTESQHTCSVILCSSTIRSSVRRLIEPALPRLAVLSYSEVSPDVQIERVASVGGSST